MPLTRIPRTELLNYRRAKIKVNKQIYVKHPDYMDLAEGDEIFCGYCDAECVGDLIFMELRDRIAICNQCSCKFT